MHLKLGPVTHEHMGLWSLRFQATVVDSPRNIFRMCSLMWGRYLSKSIDLLYIYVQNFFI